VSVPAGGTAGASASGAGTRRGWQIAQWAVAHAHDLKIEEVAFGGTHWRAAHSEKGWQQDTDASAQVRITVAR
jgi:hypothetical protein